MLTEEEIRKSNERAKALGLYDDTEGTLSAPPIQSRMGGLGAAGHGAAMGAAEGVGFLGGAIPAAKASFAAAPVFPPWAKPAAGTVGGFVGGVVGALGAGKAAEFAGVVPPEQMSREDRSIAEGARFATGSFVPGYGFKKAVDWGVIKPLAGTAKLDNWFNGVVNMAAKKPSTYLKTEVALAAGAGIGATVATEAFPDSPLATAIGGAGGAVGVAAASHTIMGRMVKRVFDWGKSTSDDKASQMLQKAIATVDKDDPAAAEKLFATIKSEGEYIAKEFPGLNVPVAALTDDPAVKAMVSALRSDDIAINAEFAKYTERQIGDIFGAIKALEATGDPQAVIAAARLRSETFAATLDARLGRFAKRTELAAKEMEEALAAATTTAAPSVRAAAEAAAAGKQATVATAGEKARAAAAAITTDEQSARAALSAQAKQAAEEISDQARAVEKTLYDAIDKNVPVPGAANVLDEVDEAGNALGRRFVNTFEEESKYLTDLSQIPAWQKIKRLVDDIIGRTADDAADAAPKKAILDAEGSPLVSLDAPKKKYIPTTGELIEARSSLLRMAREASANPNRASEARVYGKIAQSILDDLSTVREIAPAFTEARAFSRAYHDAFTRTFAGNVARTTSIGGEAVPAEMLLQKAFASNDVLASMQIDDLVDATRFMMRNSRGEGTEAQVTAMLDAQNRYLRLLMQRDVVDPTTGIANPEKIAKILRDDARLVDSRFPDIRKDLETAAQAATDVRKLADSIGGTKAGFTTDAVTKVLRVDDSETSKAIGAIVRGDTPVTSLQELVNIAGKDSVAASLWKYAQFAATRTDDGVMSAHDLLKALTSSTSTRRSLASIMQESGAVTKAEYDGLVKTIQKAANQDKRFQIAADFVETHTRAAQKESVFAKVLGFENPADAVHAILHKSARPVDDFKQLVQIAKDAGPEAVDGLRVSVLKYAIGEGDSFKNIRAKLLDPIHEGDKAGMSVVDILTDNGVVSAGYKEKLTKLLTMVERIEKSIKTEGVNLEAVDLNGTIAAAVVRAVGLKGASHVASTFGLPPLQAASMGGKMATSFYGRMTGMQHRKVLFEALQNPEKAMEVLGPVAAEQQLGQLRQFHGWLWKALGEGMEGLMADDEPQTQDAYQGVFQ